MIKFEKTDWRPKRMTEPIDNRPKFVIGGRQTGKTVTLIKEASKTGGIIVVPSMYMADSVFQTARELGYNITKPITYDQLFAHRGMNKNINKYFDEYGAMLARALRRELGMLEHYNVKNIIIDEGSINSLNDAFSELKVSDMAGRELGFKIEILGRREYND